MKTAISVPDKLFREAELLAKKSRISRSELYQSALSEYLAKHSPDQIREKMNSVLELAGKPDLGFSRSAGSRVLKEVEW